MLLISKSFPFNTICVSILLSIMAAGVDELYGIWGVIVTEVMGPYLHIAKEQRQSSFGNQPDDGFPRRLMSILGVKEIKLRLK